MTIEKLRQATRGHHAELDHLVYPIIQKTGTSADYIHLLRMFYGYVMPVHKRVDEYLDDTLIIDYSLRRKPEKILDDITYFDKSKTENISVCSDLPLINNVSSAVGAFYVLEGSTLGGKIIKEKLSSNLHIHADDAFSFFNGYGNDNGRMWNLFLTSLESFSNNGADEEMLIQGAKDTFIKFTKWIKQSLHED